MKKFIVFFIAMVVSSFVMPSYDATWVNYFRDLIGTAIVIWGSVYFALHYSYEQRSKQA